MNTTISPKGPLAEKTVQVAHVAPRTPLMECPFNPIPHCTLEFITPEQAKNWLDYNNEDNYRKFYPQLVQRYIKDIENGLWSLTTDGVGFETGTLQLCNGQHRLSAVVEAGKGQWFWVMRDLPEGAPSNPSYDTGKKRDLTQHLAHDHIANAALVSSSTRMLWRLKVSGSAGYKRSADATEALLSQVVDGAPSIVDMVQLTAVRGRIATPSVVTAWAWLAMFENPKLCMECLDIFSDRTEAFTTHPFVKLREMILRMKADKRQRSGMKEQSQLLHFFAAWEKAKGDKSVKRLTPVKSITVCDEAAAALAALGESPELRNHVSGYMSTL